MSNKFTVEIELDAPTYQAMVKFQKRNQSASLAEEIAITCANRIEINTVLAQFPPYSDRRVSSAEGMGIIISHLKASLDPDALEDDECLTKCLHLSPSQFAQLHDLRADSNLSVREYITALIHVASLGNNTRLKLAAASGREISGLEYVGVIDSLINAHIAQLTPEKDTNN